MKKSREETIQKLAKNLDKLKQKYPIKSLALFGSYARDEATFQSDIDLLVDFSAPVGMEIVDLAFELEKILQHKVDIVTYNAIKNRLFHHIKDELVYV